MSNPEKLAMVSFGRKGILLVFTCWSVGCAPESEDLANQVEFTEVGEPLAGDPIGGPASNPPEDVPQEFKAQEGDANVTTDLNQTDEVWRAELFWVRPYCLRRTINPCRSLIIFHLTIAPVDTRH